MLGSILANVLGPQNNEKIKYLKKYVEDTLNYIIECTNSDEVYYDKINELNKICDDVYLSMDPQENGLHSDKFNFTSDDDNDEGSTIASLKNKK